MDSLTAFSSSKSPLPSTLLVLTTIIRSEPSLVCRRLVCLLLSFSTLTSRSSLKDSTLHLLDAFVITSTFVLEVALRGREKELAGLLVLVRLWRLVKLAGGGELFSIPISTTPANFLILSLIAVAVGVGEVDEASLRRLLETEERLQGIEGELRGERETLARIRAHLEAKRDLDGLKVADQGKERVLSQI